MRTKVLAATVSVASNTTLVALKLIVGLMTGSVSIISEAAHSALDLFAAVIAFFSVRESGRPADKEHPFGHGKIENLSGAIEAMLILLAAMFIIHEAIDKLKYPKEVKDPMLGLYVMAASVVINVVVSKYLFLVAKRSDSIALEADAHHLSTDVWTSLGVFAGMGLIKLTGWHILDPLVAIAVALMIVRVAFSLTWKAAAPLLDTQLPDDEISELEGIVMNTPGVRSYHKLRTRKAGPYRQVDFHVIVPASMHVREAHSIVESIEEEMRRKFPNAHIVSHIEPDSEDPSSFSDSPDTTDAHGES
jgi:cation diffusion facilitator family transporter